MDDAPNTSDKPFTQRLLEAAEKATPGLWTVSNVRASDDTSMVQTEAGKWIADMDASEDADFIALANPTAIAALLRDREALREALKRVQNDPYFSDLDAESQFAVEQAVALSTAKALDAQVGGGT